MAKLIGVDGQMLYTNLLKPRIKVGNEFVTQGRNKDQVSGDSSSVSAHVSLVGSYSNR